MSNSRKATLDPHTSSDENTVQIPAEVTVALISGFLEPNALASLATTCKTFASFFKEQLSADHLLQHVMQGEEEQLKNLLEKLSATTLGCSSFILKKARGVEYSGRQWFSISPLEYAAWAGDTFFVDLLLMHISDEYKSKALQQLKAVRDNATEHGEHLSAVKSLISAYEIYDTNYDNWDPAQQDRHWISEIGGAQKMAPINLLQYYCGNTWDSWSVNSQFAKPPRGMTLRSQRSLAYIVALHSTLELVPFNGLGSSFALYGGIQSERCAARFIPFPRSQYDVCEGFAGCENDFAAVRRFYEVRKADLERQINHLALEIRPNVRP